MQTADYALGNSDDGLVARLSIAAFAMPSESEPLQAIIRAWLKRVPAHLKSLLDYQLQNLPARYFQSLDVQGVQTDLGLMSRLRAEQVIVMASEPPERPTIKVLMERDEPGTFLRVVAALAVHHVNIERALIFTGKKDGMVIDHFIVNRFVNIPSLLNSVGSVRDSLLKKNCCTPQLPAPDNAGLRVAIEHDMAQEHTTLTVYARDQTGFLFRMAKVFVELQYQLYFANVRTQRGLIMDTFHLVNKDGKRLETKEEAQLHDAIGRAFRP